MKRLSILLVALACLLPLCAQIRGNNITIQISPEHKDWNYRVGETATFTINVCKSNTLLDNVAIDYEAGPVMYPDTKKKPCSRMGQ